MKNYNEIYKTSLVALFITLSFYSCDDIPEYKPAKITEDDPLTTKNFQLCPNSDDDCGFLTNDSREEWKLIKIIDEFDKEIPINHWTECDKTEILTFTYNYTFQRRCFSEGKGITIGDAFLYSWSVSEAYGKKSLNLKLISDIEPPVSWVDWLDNIIFVDIEEGNYFESSSLKLIIDGEIREYMLYRTWKNIYE